MAVQSTGVLQATGVGSGIDINSLVSQLVAAERKPDDDRLSAAQSKANTQLSAVGQLKSALANFQDSVTALTRLSSFRARTATVADSNKLFTATASSTAALGTYEIEIDTLATAAKLTSGRFAAPTTVLGNGQLAISVGNATSTIQITDSNNTLQGIADAINAAPDNPGVRATVVTAADGAHLVVTGKKSGAANAVTINATDASPTGPQPLQALEFGPGTTNSLTATTAAADATLKIDGLPVTSADNSVDGALPGVTISLLGAEPNTTNTLTVADDQSAVTATINQFVTAYNAFVSLTRGLTAYDATKNTAGPLLGDSVARNVNFQLRRAIAAVGADPSAAFRSLSDIGIQFQTDGTLQVNSGKLSSALQTNLDGVGQLFAKAGSGVAVRLGAYLDEALGASGPLTAETAGLQKQLKSIATQQDQLNARIATLQATYQAQFTAMDTLISQLKSTSNFLTQQLTSTTSKTG
jgi:flagellar hook-associated protein 2